MANTSVQTGAPAPKGLIARAIGIITAPRATYEAVVAHPKSFGMLALVTISIAVLVGGLLMTKVGQEAWLDAALSSGREFNEQQMQGMQRMMPFMGYVTAVSMLVFWPLILLLISGILYAVFNAAMGGNATFRQVFAVVVHTGPVGVLAQLFTVPLNYFRGTMTSASNLGVLLPMLPEKSFFALLLGMIDLFLIWQLVVLSIGLAVLYRRRTQPIATALLVVYAIIAVIVAFIRRGAGA
jgi:hypothetical protein